jgi:hypothetical protein
MKRLLLVACLLGFMPSLSHAQSGMSEKDRKRAEKEALRKFKKMEPAQVKAIYDRLQKTEARLQSSDSTVMVLGNENASLRAELDSTKAHAKVTQDSLTGILVSTNDSLVVLKTVYEETAQKLLEAEDRLLRPKKYKNKGKYKPGVSSSTTVKTGNFVLATGGSKESMKAPSGIYFRVQIGAYKTFKLNQSASQGPLGTETEGDIYKYLFGYYSTLEEAEQVKTDFVKMGIKDAWVVGFDNGKRISKEEAASKINK